MLHRSLASVAILAIAACASSPETAKLSASYKAPSLTNLSRIEIAQKYRFEERTLPEYEGGVLSAASSDLTQGHDEAAKLPDRYDGSRIENLGGKSKGTVIYHRTQADIPQGWIDGGETLVHGQSGLSCPRLINIENEGRQFVLERIVQFDGAGRDVGCALVSNSGGAAITVYASYWPDVSRDDHAMSAAASIYQRFTVSEQLPVPVVTLSPAEGVEGKSELFDGMEEVIAGGFGVGDVNGVPYKTSFWIAKTHDWHVKIRATYPQEDLTSEIVAAVYFSAAHLGVRAKNMTEPTVPGVDV